MSIGANDWGVEKYRNKIKTRLISEKKMHSAVLGVIFYSKIIPKIYIPHVHPRNNLFQASNRSSDLFIRGCSQTTLTRRGG